MKAIGGQPSAMMSAYSSGGAEPCTELPETAVFLVHSNTTDESQVFYDEIQGLTGTVNGTAAQLSHSTDKAYFGDSSMYSSTQDGDQYVLFGPDADYTTTNTTHTMAMWYNESIRTTGYGYWFSDHGQWDEYMSAYATTFVIRGGYSCSHSTTYAFTAGVWYHLAYLVVNATGVYGYINGNLALGKADVDCGAANMIQSYIRLFNDSAGDSLAGYVDEILMAKERIWPGNFTPPTDPWCNP
jgi:hypothetical protein